MTLELRRARFERHGPELRNFSYAGLAFGSPTLITTDPRFHDSIVAAGVLAGEGKQGPGRARAEGPVAASQNLGRGQKFVIAGVAAALLTCAVPFLLVGPLAPVAVRLIPKSTDRKMGDNAFEEARIALSNGAAPGKDAECHQPEIRSVIDAVMDRLHSPLHRQAAARGFTFQVHVIDSNMVNAFALPGGHMMVTTGLLSLLDTPEELAGVMAHEINHVTLRHGVEKMVRDKGVSMLFQSSDGVAKLLVTGAAFLGTMSFSRDNETEADEGGVELAIAADIDPNGLLGFFRKVDKLEKGECEKADDGIAFTHPLTKDRIAHTRERIEKSGRKEWSPIVADWKAMDSELARMEEARAQRRGSRGGMFRRFDGD